MVAPVRNENVTEPPVGTCTNKAALHADAIPVGHFAIGKATQTFSDSVINATNAAQSNSSKIKQILGDILSKAAVAGSKRLPCSRRPEGTTPWRTVYQVTQVINVLDNDVF